MTVSTGSGHGENTSAASGSLPAPAYESRRVSTSTRSAALPGSRLPTSSRPRQRAPPRVASQKTSSAVSQRSGSRPWRCASSAWRASASMFELSLLAEPSTPRPTGTPASSISRTGAMPEPSRKFEVGQWATPVPVSPKRRISSGDKWTQWASQTSLPSQPSRRRNSTGRQP